MLKMHALFVFVMKIYFVFTYFIPLIPLAIIDFWVYPHNKLKDSSSFLR
jgi:hypothetical protein